MANFKKSVFIKDTDNNARTKSFYDYFLAKIREKNLEDQFQIVRAADIGLYGKGIAVKIFPDDLIYIGVSEDQVDDIIEKTLKKGVHLKEFIFQVSKKQKRVVLRNCGVIDPESIEEYISQNGYQAFKKMLESQSPQEVIEQVKVSGLRGRGGGGFPTWLKWDFARKVSADQKYIICNGDEGDPGAYMDRSILEGDPHSVLEGMLIAGFATGASKGFFYIRAEYPLAIKRVQRAIDDAYLYGILGKKIFDTSFSFDLEIRLGAGAFVCGEETALIASVEGQRGYPRPRPPYPSVKGLWDCPTIINNVETLANVPIILLKGGAWYAGIGTEKSRGTKVFALTGKVRNSGLVEVPMGTTLREIVFDIGGGMLEDKKFKAVQTGGPSGGVVPEDYLDTPVDYESLQKLGSIMGSGGMIVMDETDCMVDIAKFYLGFCVDESCGKCAPCRIGGFQLLNLLTKISDGKGQEQDLEKLNRISLGMKRASLCGLGQSAPNPVLSTLNYFAKEYQFHVSDKKCPAHKCLSFFKHEIIQEKCKRCGLCFRHCPVRAISGDKQKGYVVDSATCIQCGRCYEVCKFSAIAR